MNEFMETMETLAKLISTPPQKEIAEFIALQSIIECNNNSDSGNTKEEVMENIRNRPYEVTAVFDKHGAKLFEHTDKSSWLNHICACDRLCQLADTSIHNHTVDTTFSSTDLSFSAVLDLNTHILVTPSSTYYMQRPKFGWPEDDSWCEELVMLAHSIYYRCNINRATARHRAMLKVTEEYKIPYYQLNVAGNSISKNACCS